MNWAEQGVMMLRYSKLISFLFLIFFTTSVFADTALILHSNYQDAHTNVKAQLEADGYTVTLSTDGSVPDNLINNYDVVFDLKYNNNIGSNGKDRYDDFVENIGLNLGGYFTTSQKFARYFQKQGYGNIINISSIYGVVAPKFEVYDGTTMTTPVEYAAIKSGLIHLTKYMAKYFKGMNIKVNTLSPGGIFDNQPETFLENYKDQCLDKGMLDKSDLKGTLVFLLSDMSKYINGQNIIVDDGFSL